MSVKPLQRLRKEDFTVKNKGRYCHVMKIDIYAHVMLEHYRSMLYKHVKKFATELKVQSMRPVLTDTKARLEKLRPFKDVTQILSTTMPPLEEVVSRKEAAILARICNEEMAELVSSNPKRYAGAIANLPLNDMKATLKEAQYAIEDLGFKGVQIYSRINGKPPSAKEYLPLFELMVAFDLPIWIHPMRSSEQSDYSRESISHNQIFSIFGWPFDTTVAMIRLVFAGIFEKFPTIKIITHHGGGMIPYFSDRLAVHFDNGLERLGTEFFPGLTKPPVDYLKMFYVDTALNGNPSALSCVLDFFGEDHLLFGTDMPYDIDNGAISISRTINAIEAMKISETARQKIYAKNAKRLLKL
jgi:predicted TIM-barrel fold metal-dependent hydrolase